MQLKLSGKRWSKDFYVYIHKLFEWVRVLCKSFKHNKYLWLSQILTQLKDHLPTGVLPRCWRKVHHQCVLLFRHLCSVYIRFPSWDGNANHIPSLLCSQVLSFTFLVVEKRDKAGKKETLGTSLMVSQFLLGVFLYYREIANQVICTCSSCYLHRIWWSKLW